MAVTELDTQIKYKNTSGDTTIIYPITKAENIVDLLSSTAPAFTYGIDDIVPGSESNKPDGTLHFVYVTNGGNWDHVKSIFITINGVWRLVLDNSTVS